MNASTAPAFKFVLVFIGFLLSDLHKAVHMPIVNTPNSIAEDCPEAFERNRDDEWGVLPSHSPELPGDYPTG